MKNARHILLSIFFTVFSLGVNAQEDIDFVQDFDYLYNSIQENCISYQLFCDAKGISGEDIYLKLKKELEADNSFLKFTEVSSKLFNISAEKHSGFVYPTFFDFYLENYVTEREKRALLLTIDTAQIATSKANYREIRKIKRKLKKKWSMLKTTYWNGKYYLTYDYEINDEKIPRGSIIKTINGAEPQEFYNKRIENVFPYFDINTAQFYAYNLTNILSDINDTLISLTLELPSNEIVEIDISESDVIDIKSWNKLILGFKNKVKYFSKNNTLYIRFFSLDFDFQKKQPIEYLGKYQKKQIDRIIIDLRGNGGGNDLMWVQLMSAIQGFKEPVKQPALSMYKNSKSVDYFKTEDFIDSVDSFAIYKNDILSYIGPDKSVKNEKSYAQIEELYDNIPHLNYQGEIYCLIDDVSFSGSLSFASLKYYFNNFHVVSAYSPYYGGMASTPILFMLPSSKLIYRLTSNFDYQIYNNQHRVMPDIPVDLTIDDILEKKNRGILNYNSKKYWGKKNKYIQAVINYE